MAIVVYLYTRRVDSERTTHENITTSCILRRYYESHLVSIVVKPLGHPHAALQYRMGNSYIILCYRLRRRKSTFSLVDPLLQLLYKIIIIIIQSIQALLLLLLLYGTHARPRRPSSEITLLHYTTTIGSFFFLHT